MTSTADIDAAYIQALPAIGWCDDARSDPITGLVAFPDFHAHFPTVLKSALADGATIGLAIGDVDNLKTYVETANETDPLSFGHLAGNAVMSRLGQVARAWFWNQSCSSGLVSTFGGDEIIVAMDAATIVAFIAALRDLRGRLNSALPCTVSFAATVIRNDSSGTTDDIYLHAMTALDRCLFARKTIRRAASATASFLMEVDLLDGSSREAHDG